MFIFEERPAEKKAGVRTRVGEVCLGRYKNYAWQGTLVCLGTQSCATNPPAPRDAAELLTRQRVGSTTVLRHLLHDHFLSDGTLVLPLVPDGGSNAAYLHNCWQIWRQQYERPWVWLRVRADYSLYVTRANSREALVRALFAYHCGGLGHSIYCLRYPLEAAEFIHYYEQMPKAGEFRWHQFDSLTAATMLRGTLDAQARARAGGIARRLRDRGWWTEAKPPVEDFLEIVEVLDEDKHTDAWD